jgi:hypothetical protein
LVFIIAFHTLDQRPILSITLNILPMYDLLKVGEEVTFPGLLDIKLIIEEVYENKGNVRCKYYDDHLKRFIKLTLPADSLLPVRKTPAPKLRAPINH